MKYMTFLLSACMALSIHAAGHKASEHGHGHDHGHDHGDKHGMHDDHHDEMSGKMVEYTYGGTTYEGYYIAHGNAPLVVLVHDWDGLTSYEIKRAEMLKEQGYAVFAVDLFGKGVRPTQTSEKKHQTGLLYKDREKMRGLMDAGLAAAKKAGANSTNAVAMGYCFGGAVVLESARSGANYKGFATFHGGLSTPKGQNYDNVAAPIMVYHGTADTAIPMTQFADLAARLESANVDHEMITYSGAPHAFTVFGSKRYRETADTKSWSSFLEFLESVK